jgi:hypothetical protein
MLTKDRFIFDPADLIESDTIGAYLRAGSDGDLLTSTLSGGKEALDVNVVGTSDGGIFAEDSVHSSGDKGQFILAVQTAAQGALATDGDYAPLQVDSSGRLRCLTDIDLVGDLVGDDEPDTEDPLKVGSRAVSGALAAISASGDKANLISDMYRRVWINDSPNIAIASVTRSVDNVAEVLLPASALAGRRRIIAQNLGPNDIYVGPTGVTTSSGLRIAKGATLEIPLGQNVPLYGISGNVVASDIRVFEAA